MGGIVILASLEKHFIGICKNLSQHPRILYKFHSNTSICKGDNENNTVENDAIEERLTNTVAKKDKTIISDSDEDELDCSEKIEAGSDSVPAIATPIKVSINNPMI